MQELFSNLKDLKNELQNIIKGKSGSGHSQPVQAAKAYLNINTKTGEGAEEKEYSRAEEERALINYAENENRWITPEIFGTYITEGAEQKVYYPGNSDYTIKVSDAVFYRYWKDYFNSLLIHNHLFPDTAYSLLGFYKNDERLFEILKQSFIIATEITDIENIKSFLQTNGFEHKKNNDYYHQLLGIIIEDLHDENVLTNEGVLFFVDTVIYLTDNFYT
jgi:Serine/Threonine/Tyrosine Kinase found in polyvalent proteins